MQIHEAALAPTLTALQQEQHSLSLYVENMCKRIESVNPHVQAFLPEPRRMARLREDVQQLRRRFPDRSAKPPLWGALVGVKDILHVDGYPTQAGSQLPAERLAGAEARCVTLLREAGALIAGKTVTTEFAYFEPGPTRNPHNLAHTPGGSSSGSAAAVAAGLCTLALGTQTIGSVIRPAAYCGVVGFKPTYARIPTEGVLYFSRTVDHIGIFTQDVAGMQQAAAVLCRDWQHELLSDRPPVIGVPTGAYLAQADPDALTAFHQQLYQLADAGFTVKQVPALAEIEQLNELHRRLAFAEFAQEHAELYAEFSALYRPRTAEIIEIGKTVDHAELTAARANCQILRTNLETAMDEQQLDLWASPAAPGTAPLGIAATGNPNMNLPWTHAGMPAVTVPAGIGSEQLPLGMQLVARYGADEALLHWASMLAPVFARP
ncbi:MAG: amidase [Caldilineaceae bacterium]|nr:amidase [Caldilineaceae bacterium]